MHEFLGSLQVGRISGVTPKTEQALKNIGIETTGQLGACDVQTLEVRFGRNGLWMWKVATGSDERAVQPREDHVSLITDPTLDVYKG
jgi:DNA polymerase-4